MVEWKKLGEISEIGTGSNNREDATDNGRYPFYVRSKDVLKIDSYLFDEEAILIPGEGGIGDIFHYINGKYGLHQRAYRVHPITGNAKGRYIYYYLFANFKAYINTKSYKSTAASIRRPMLLDFPIAIPSLQEQERIVGILDTFTASIDNIKAQIEQRRKQYEHYRNTLLTFNKDDDSVEWKTLGEVGDISAGGDVPRNTIKETNPIENYCFPVYSNGKENNSLYGYSTSYSIATQAVTISARGTIGWHCVREAYFTPIIRLITVIPDEKILSAKYLDYALYVTRIGGDNGGIPQLTVPSIKNCEIPLPSLQEQQRIVSILDTFEASITNLEAQLEQRQKQYEYYREKLLTFE